MTGGLDLVGPTLPPSPRSAKHKMMLITLAGVLAVVGTLAAAYYFEMRPVTLRIAVGPANSDDIKVVQALTQAFTHAHSHVRLRPMQTDGATASAQALADGKADLAIIRGDLEVPKNAQAVATLRKNVAVLWVPPSAKGKGKKAGPKDAIDLSFLATSGTGLREISWTDGAQATLDFSALHLALSPLTCNIHIDEFGVVIATADGQTTLSPNALHHIANELILKTIIKEFLRDKIGLPPKYIDHLFVELPNTANRFNQYGAGLEFHPWQSVKITAGYACNVFDGEGCRKNFTLTKSF